MKPPTDHIKSLLTERRMTQAMLGRAIQALVPGEALASIHAQVSRCLGPAPAILSRWWWLIFHALQIPYPNDTWGAAQGQRYPLDLTSPPDRDDTTMRVVAIGNRLNQLNQDYQRLKADVERMKR